MGDAILADMISTATTTGCAATAKQVKYGSRMKHIDIYKSTNMMDKDKMKKGIKKYFL
jgi:hypothetical protein